MRELIARRQRKVEADRASVEVECDHSPRPLFHEGDGFGSGLLQHLLDLRLSRADLCLCALRVGHHLASRWCAVSAMIWSTVSPLAPHTQSLIVPVSSSFSKP